MPDADDLLNGLPPDLALYFFATFGRFEFALKYAGCLKPVKNGKAAEASRTILATMLPQNFFDQVRASGLAETLLNDPPKNLVVLAGNLSFADRARKPKSISELLDTLWHVRNNLFHGNKMHPANRNRDRALMTETLAVIDAVLDAAPRVASAFNEPQQFF